MIRNAYFLLLLLLPGWSMAQYVPQGSPDMETIFLDNSPLCEYLFMGTYRFIAPSPRKSTNCILDKEGELVWYMQHPNWMLDFKIHPNGQMSFLRDGLFHIMDSTFTIIDTVRCVDRWMDSHELMITEDNHYWMICFEDTVMDLSMLTTRNGLPGSSTALVLATVVQEQDSNEQVVREWRAIEHFDVTDADPAYFTNPNSMELNHSNSVDIRDDGAVLVSSRANHEVTCIDWPTGRVLWRLGGPNNQFVYTNDSVGTNSQHDARWLPDGQVSVFDNSSLSDPPGSRAIVYEIDTLAWTATKTWELARPDLESDALGSFRVLEDSTYLINWGRVTTNQPLNVTYAHRDCTTIAELHYENTYWTYRASCSDLPWALQRPVVTCDQASGELILTVVGNYPSYLWSNGSLSQSIIVQDTGSYQVFVPYGVGFIGSEVLHWDGITAPCPAVSADPEQEAPVRRKVTGRYDLLGRPVQGIPRGILFIEQYQDGSSRKRIVW